MVNLKPLLDEIDRSNLKESWADTLYEMTDKETIIRVDDKLNESISSYIKMMASPKNDGSARYLNWAIHQSLGISSKCRVANGVNRRRGRALN